MTKVRRLPVPFRGRAIRRPDDIERVRGIVAELREMAGEQELDRNGLLSIAARLDAIVERAICEARLLGEVDGHAG
ncbi:hypothetical protein GAY33_17370 [Azospirillum brasilense]|uniref:hypothetical protein n=1 Tax=Azospirillum argentinense TaxID=2970906 RepID=UPI00190E92EC|nr:hypothetical protein [Azospirillum argentinense]MBK3800975.1 hypothetical protein [Azospirillum argentinense]